MNTISLPQNSWLGAARHHAQNHTLAFVSLSLGLLAVLVLLTQSVWTLASGEFSVGVRYGLLGGLAGFAATRPRQTDNAFPNPVGRPPCQRVHPGSSSTLLDLPWH